MSEISVIIPLWNKEPYIRNTLESVINQTVNDFEILVITDVENLTGKYYKYYAIAHMKAGDRENAVRCLRESIRYLRGGFLLKPVFLRIILLLPRRVWKVLQYVRV